MKRQKLANVSPWLLAAACALLALIIAVFAVNNYRREKKLMSDALVQKGLTIIRFVKSSSRASFRGNRMNIRMNAWQWTDHVQQAIENSVEQPGLEFLGLIDEEGDVLAGSEKNNGRKKVDASTLTFIRLISKDENQNKSIFRIRKADFSNEPVFQIAALYHPFGPSNLPPRVFRHGFRSKPPPDDISGFNTRGTNFFEQLHELSEKKFFLVVELDMTDFNNAVRRQKIQIMILSFVLLLVGVGGWLSLLTLQGLKGSQLRLRQVRQFNDILVSSLPVGLVATGKDSKIRLFNNSAEKMVGISSADVLGKVPHKVLPAQLADELSRNTTEAINPEPCEIELRNRYNKTKSLLLATIPVIDSDKNLAGNTLIIQDVSKIKQLQEQVRRNERLAALGKMAAGVAHELRNPLSSIKGLALLLKSKLKKDIKGKETADILVQEVERLNRSIGELLDFARPDKLQLEKIMLSEVVDQSVTLMEADIESADIKLSKEYQDINPVYADADKLKQVILNLLLNSLQAVENDAKIEVKVFEEEKNVVFQLDDNGCGLEEESVARVFDPYFTTKNEGTGLGLAMSAKIIEAHSGSIEFSSSKGAGTSVKIYLPVSQEES